jgi:glycine/D-amino acid oxidase-like deaminating enzyme
MAAYYAASLADSVTVLERTTIGDPATASFALTRSVRQDYPDPQYATLAAEARRLWLRLQQESGRRLLVDCGCLNLASANVTGADLAASYGARTHAVLTGLGLRSEALGRDQLAARYPQFSADAGWLDADAGYADVAVVTQALTAALRARGVTVAEEAVVRGLRRDAGCWQVGTAAGTVESDAVIVAAGLGTNGLLDLLPGRAVRFPLSPDRPIQSKYFIPRPGQRDQFTEAVLPVFAYLDVGIYGHPILDDRTPGVKIGFYHPPGAQPVPSPVGSVEDFVAHCMPSLRGAEVVDVAAVSGVDTCAYDLVADDEFIIGPVPGASRLYAGVGWRGTGYKFAPWAGLVLAQLAAGQHTEYDIERFRPSRFGTGVAA